MLAQLLSDSITNFISTAGYLGVFLLMAGESAALPIPSEIVLPFAGYCTHLGSFELWPVILIATIGQVFGSAVAYFIALYGGRKIIIKYVLFDHKALHVAESWFMRWGSFAIFFSRLMPIVRTFIAIPAGLARMNFVKFVFYTFIGSLPWTAALVYIGYLLGPHWQSIVSFFNELDILTVVVFTLILVYIFRERIRACLRVMAVVKH